MKKRTIIFITTLFFVVPFAGLDLYFGLFYKEQPNCTQTNKLFQVLSLHQWFAFIGSVEGFYLLIYLASQLKRKCGNEFQMFYLNALEEVYSLGLAVKAIFCCVVELCLFFGVVSKFCGGPFYGYNLALCCLHITKLTAVGMSLLRNWCC